MDTNHRELARRLFTRATEILEDTVEAAVAGQSAKGTRHDYARRANALSAAGRELCAIAEIIDGVMRHNPAGPKPRRERHSR
jgi:hypothetical protein